MLVTLHICAAYRKVKKISVKRYLAVKNAITVDLRTWNSVDEVKPSKHYSAVDQPDTPHVGSGLTTGSYGMLQYTTRLLTITIRLAEQISNSITFKEIIFLLNFTDGVIQIYWKYLKNEQVENPFPIHLSPSKYIHVWSYIHYLFWIHMYLTVKILALLLFMANGKVHVARWINKAHIISCKLSISNEY